MGTGFARSVWRLEMKMTRGCKSPMCLITRYKAQTVFFYGSDALLNGIEPLASLCTELRWTARATGLEPLSTAYFNKNAPIHHLGAR